MNLKRQPWGANNSSVTGCALAVIVATRCRRSVGFMKSSSQRSDAVRRQRSQELAETHIAAIFERMPVLSAFTLRADLEVTDIETSTWPGYIPRQELYEDLMQALARPRREAPGHGRNAARAHLRAYIPLMLIQFRSLSPPPPSPRA